MQELKNQEWESNNDKNRANDVPVQTWRQNEQTYYPNQQTSEHTSRKKEEYKNGRYSQVQQQLVVSEKHNTPHAERHRSVHRHHHHHNNQHQNHLDHHSSSQNEEEYKKNENRMQITGTEMEAARAQSVWPTGTQRLTHKHFIPLPPNYHALNNGLSLPPIAREQLILNSAAHPVNTTNESKNVEMENTKRTASPINNKERKVHGHERSVSVSSRKESNRAASHSLRAMLRVTDAPVYYKPITSTINHDAQSKSIEHSERHDNKKQKKENYNINRHTNEARQESESQVNVKYNPLRKLSFTVSSIFSRNNVINNNNRKVDVTENSKKNKKNNTSLYRIPLDQLSSLKQTEVFASNDKYGNETSCTKSNDKGRKNSWKNNEYHHRTHDKSKLMADNTYHKHKKEINLQNQREELPHKRLQQEEQEQEEEKEYLEPEREKQNGYYTVNLEDEIHLSYDDNDSSNINHDDDQNNDDENVKDEKTKRTAQKMKSKERETNGFETVTQASAVVDNNSDDGKVEQIGEAEQSSSKPTNTNVKTKNDKKEAGNVKKTRFWTTLQFQHNIARAMIKHDNERMYGLLKKYNKLVAQNEADARRLFTCTNPLCTNSNNKSTQQEEQQQQQQQQQQTLRQEVADNVHLKQHKEVLIEDIDDNDFDDYGDQTLATSNNNETSNNNVTDEIDIKDWVNQPIKIVKRSILDKVLDPETGYTLMHLAVLTKDIDCVRICLNYGTEAHRVEDLQGDTPLTLAMKRFPSCVMTLFYNGQNVRVHKPLGLQHIPPQHHSEKRHSFEETQESVKAEGTNESKSKMPHLRNKLSSLRNILHRIGGNITNTTTNPVKSSKKANATKSNADGETDENNKSEHQDEIIMQHYSQTLVHRAVIADALTPPWPERLEFIKLLVSQYHVNAGSTDYYGFTPSMWAMQHEPYLLPHELYKSLMRYLNHAARVAAYESELNKMSGLDYGAILELAGIPSSSIDRAVSESVARSPQEMELPLHLHASENVTINTNGKSNTEANQRQQFKKEKENELVKREKMEMAIAGNDLSRIKKLAKVHKEENSSTKNDHTVNEKKRLEESPTPIRPETNTVHNILSVNPHEASHAVSTASPQRWRLSTIPQQNLCNQTHLNNVFSDQNPSERKENENSNVDVHSKKLPPYNKREHSTASYDKLKTNNTKYNQLQKNVSHCLHDATNEIQETNLHESQSSVITIMQRPSARLLILVAIFIFHNIENALDVSTSTLHVFRNEFWFRIINMVFSGWSGSPFFMGLVHLVCLLVGMVIIGYYIMYVGLCKRLLCYVCQIPSFGAQSKCELAFWQCSFGAAYKDKHYGKANRSRIFTLPFSVLNGILISSAVYNALMHSYWPGQVRWMSIRSVIGENNYYIENNRISMMPLYTTNGLSYIDQSRIVWSMTLAIDWLIICTVVHMMYEQGILNVYLPSYACSSFANWIDSKRYAVYHFTHRHDADNETEQEHKNMEETYITEEERQNNTKEHQTQSEQEEEKEKSKNKANKFAIREQKQPNRKETYYYNNQHWCTHSARSTSKFILSIFWIMLFVGWVLIAIPFTVVGVVNSSHKLHNYQLNVDTYHINKDNNYSLYKETQESKLQSEVHTNTPENNILEEVQVPLLSDYIEQKEHKRVTNVNYIRCCAAILFASINMSLLCIACLQDWNWPTLQSHVLLTLPGTIFTGHNSWLLILLLYVSWTCSQRNLIENWRIITRTHYIDFSDNTNTTNAQLNNVIQRQHVYSIPAIAVATIFTLPAVLSVCFVCVAVISTSLHFVRYFDKDNNNNWETVQSDNNLHNKTRRNRNDNVADDNNNSQRPVKSITQWRYGWHLFHKPASPLISLLFYYFDKELKQLNKMQTDANASCDIAIMKENTNILTSKKEIAMLQLLELLRETNLLDLSSKQSQTENNKMSVDNKHDNNNKAKTDKKSTKLQLTSPPSFSEKKIQEEEELRKEYELEYEEEELLSATSPLEVLALLTAFEVILPNKRSKLIRDKIIKETNKEKEQLAKQGKKSMEVKHTEMHKLLHSKTAEAKVCVIRWILKTRLHYKTYKQQLYRNEMLARGVQGSIQYTEVLADIYRHNNNYDDKTNKNEYKSNVNAQRNYEGVNNTVLENQNKQLSNTATKNNNNSRNKTKSNNEERRRALISRPSLQSNSNLHPRHKQPLWHRASDASTQRMLNRKRQYSIRKREQEYLQALDKWRQKKERKAR